ncbi:MAG: hypothetical protein ACTSWK_04150 [Promethearchaeota archaeon]
MKKCDRCEGTGIDPELDNNQLCKKCSGLKELDWIQNITGVDITRKEKTIVYTVKMLNDLVKMGIISGGALKLGENAEDIIKDFEPSQDELEEAMLLLKQQGYI